MNNIQYMAAKVCAGLIAHGRLGLVPLDRARQAIEQVESLNLRAGGSTVAEEMTLEEWVACQLLTGLMAKQGGLGYPNENSDDCLELARVIIAQLGGDPLELVGNGFAADQILTDGSDVLVGDDNVLTA